QYEVVAWTAHTIPSADTIYAVAELSVSSAQWDEVFPSAAASVKPKVSAASAAGLTVTTELANIVSPTGAYVAVIEAGTASELSQSNMGLAMEFVRPTAFTDGAATSTLEVAAAKLDRSKQYEVVAWTAHTIPSADTIYAVAELSVSSAQWDQVLPSAGTKLVTGISNVSSAGISTTNVISDIELDAGDAGIYVAFIERGTEAELSGTNMGLAYAFVPRANIKNGAATVQLEANAEALDRNTEYEVIVWRAHGLASKDRMLARADVKVTEEQWDEVVGVEFVASGKAAVSDAAKNTLSVTASLRGIDPASYPQGVHVALIKAGTAAKATPIGTQTVATIPANGAVTAVITASAKDLNRAQKYDVLVWSGKTGPSASANVLTLPLTVTAAQWDAVFPPKVDTLAGSFEWGVRKQFREYVTGPIASGKITVSSPATGTSVYKFPQVAGGSWDAKKQTGSVKFAGNVNFTGHSGALNLNLTNPVINVTSANRAELRAEYGGKLLTIATMDLAKAKKQKPTADSVRFTGAPVTLTEAGAKQFFQEYLNVGDTLDTASFTVGVAANVKPVTPPTPTKPTKPTKPTTEKPVQPAPVAPAANGQQAGSLTWGVSSGFAAYTTGRIAKGSVGTSGVGGGAGAYVFPQSSSSWDAASQTGTVQYSGVVTFTGHKGLMSESFSNPVIAVTGPSSGTLTAGGRTFGLNLGAGSKSVGANGEVTWTGVPLSGAISGSGNGGGGAFGADPVSFTVGAVSGATFGATAVGAVDTKRTAAASAPTTSGIRVITPAADLVPGGEIEFEAAGFEAKERDVLVVLYSDPIVLDDAAGADANGVVRWIGALPEDLEPGEHTITLQGSADAGAVITVLAEKAKKKKSAEQPVTPKASVEAVAEAPMAAGVAQAEPSTAWIWWASAAGLLLIAGTLSGLVVAQRRRNSEV
ncbi:HtaA domain-containing protein, partial [Leucobacter luti]|uniref:HtaA domain-containing protein n=1 Tax=Leucobacter luti TaxID=340320 RepID=UPI0018E541B3